MRPFHCALYRFQKTTRAALTGARPLFLCRTATEPERKHHESSTGKLYTRGNGTYQGIPARLYAQVPADTQRGRAEPSTPKHAPQGQSSSSSRKARFSRTGSGSSDGHRVTAAAQQIAAGKARHSDPGQDPAHGARQLHADGSRNAGTGHGAELLPELIQTGQRTRIRMQSPAELLRQLIASGCPARCAADPEPRPEQRAEKSPTLTKQRRAKGFVLLSLYPIPAKKSIEKGFVL